MSLLNEEDLNRANIQAAWHFAPTMTPQHFDELCRVTAEQLRRDAQAAAEARTVLLAMAAQI